MNIELINTGTELMLGRILNTHQQWLCRQLADRGYRVNQQIAIADDANSILDAVRYALTRADLIITTGGLGPTSDDITRELIAKLLGKKLQLDATILAEIEKFFAVRKKSVPEHSKIQALVPEGANVLPNPNGTAPGLAMELRPNSFRTEGKPTWLMMLPGPPRELRPMFTDFVVPLLQKYFPTKTAFACRTLRTTGIGESSVQERIAAPLQKLISSGLELGYCAKPGQVDVRLAARGQNADKLVRNAEKIVQTQLATHVFTCDDEELETVIVRLLTERKQTLALAESCTGGAIANRITNVPGASIVFLAGLVTYSNEAKKKFLGVLEKTLAQHGAVSEAVAREMAEGARKQTLADYALSATGIAGPTGGTANKPVGTVFIGLAGPLQTFVEHFMNPYDRATFKEVAAQQALDLLRRNLSAIV